MPVDARRIPNEKVQADHDHRRHGDEARTRPTARSPNVPRDPTAFDDAFARAWFKLTHRDMGPKVRYLGPEVPAEDLIWQDPVPAGTTRRTATWPPSRKRSLDSGLSVANWSRPPGRGLDLPRVRTIAAAPTARASASMPCKATGRSTIRKNSGKVLAKLDELAAEAGDISMADAIVLAGNVGDREGRADGGFDVSALLAWAGRGDATDETTDADSFEPLEPFADGFRNYLKTKDYAVKTEEMLLDRAQLLGLTMPEMTVLLGGMRALGVQPRRHGKHRRVHRPPGALTNDFFVNLLEMGVMWEVIDESGDEEFVGKCRLKGDVKWPPRTDLVFGSNSQLRAVAEVYAENGNEQKFVDGLRERSGPR